MREALGPSSARTSPEDSSETTSTPNDAATAAFDITSRLLTLNPEYYTVWNHRRRLLQVRLSSSSPEEIPSTLRADLAFILPVLIKFPKCYWIWNHRQWLLQQTTERLPPLEARGFWEAELGLVGKMLARDSRNFHGWGYRRKVVAALESTALNPPGHIADGSDPAKATTSMAQEEFDYTTRMIRTNLSNFSAWHSRSKLIPRLLDERAASREDRRTMLDDGAALAFKWSYMEWTDEWQS